MSGRAATINVVPGLHALSVGRTDMPAPRGWTWLPLEEVARLESGHTPSREHPEYWDGGIPWIGIKDARAHHAGVILQTLQTVTQAGIDNSAARVLPTGTVCLSRTASVGYVVVTGREMATSQDFVNWICGPALDPHFLKYLFIAENESLQRFSKGTTHSTIYYPEVKAFHVCLPPLAEQKRIVAKLEELTARSRRAKEALDAVPPLLDQLRQSILAAAFRGDLTADWRAKNPDVEPASKFLARIREEWRSNSSIHVRGQEPQNTRPAWSVPQEIQDLVRPHVDRLSSLGWSIASLAEVCDPTRPITYGIVQTGEPNPAGVPTVRCGDVKFGGITLQDLKRVAPELEAQYPRTRLRGGEVLVAIRGTVGGVAVAGPELEGANISREVAMLAPLCGLVPEFLALLLSSPYGATLLSHHTKGVAQSGVNISDLRAFPVLIPPEPEQLEIVRRVTAAFSRTRGVLDQVKHSRSNVDRLDESALAKAFRGDLVPQDPSDEPAAELVSRIRSSRDTVSLPGGSGRRFRKETEVDERAAVGSDRAGVSLPPRQPTTAAQVSLKLPEIDDDTIHDEVFTALWTLGPLGKQQATRRLADHLRATGRIHFDHLTPNTPLHTQLLAAIDSAVAANHLDRPLPNHVRAIKPDPTSYTPDDWQHILLTTLPTTRTDRETAIRTAAEYARDNLGLRFSRLRSEGHIVQALRSAITTAIRRGDVLRHGSTHISRVPDDRRAESTK